jgi:regulator of replication initiation timing
MEEEPLMNLRPKTPEERVLWLEFEKKELVQQNQKLNMEIGILQSEIDEMKHLMKTEEKGALIIRNRKLKELLIQKKERIKALEKENELFLQKIIKLQTP